MKDKITLQDVLDTHYAETKHLLIRALDSLDRFMDKAERVYKIKDKQGKKNG